MRYLAPVLLLLIVLCAPQTCFCQTTDCLPPATRVRIADSLRVLPKVREEAQSWRAAAGFYRNSADHYRASDSLHVSALAHCETATAGTADLLANQTNETAAWKQRARRRSVANIVLLALATAIGYLAITH